MVVVDGVLRRGLQRVAVATAEGFISGFLLYLGITMACSGSPMWVWVPVGVLLSLWAAQLAMVSGLMLHDGGVDLYTWVKGRVIGG